MSEDNWKHRSDGMKCATCMWGVIKVPTPFIAKELNSGEIEEIINHPNKILCSEHLVGEPAVKSSVGRCRRRAPTMNGYPVIFADDWCGDHKLDENKL